MTYSDTNLTRPSARSRAAAWAVHGFTASGVLWGLLAILSIARGEYRPAFAFMTAAVAVDSFDGMLARWAQVKETLPQFDGTLLDNVVDYLNYVFVPAVLIHEVRLLPPSWALAASVLICLASAYQFCQIDAKTSDHFFRGFPSYWNVLAFYLVLGGLDRWMNLVIVLSFVVLVFVPIKWIYPSRMERLRGLTLVATAAWGVACIAMLIQYPEPAAWLLSASLLYVAYYVGISLYLGLSRA